MKKVMNFVGKSSQVYCITLICIFAVSCSTKSPEKLAQVLTEAHFSGKPIPMITKISSGIHIPQAYAVQYQFVKALTKRSRITGYKAGLTSKVSRDRFQFIEPIGGVLFESGFLADNTQIEINKYRRLNIEVEIGLLVGSRIAEPPTNIDDLLEKIHGAVPVVELPDLGFESIGQVTGLDLIAANVCSGNYIIGKSKFLDGYEMDELTAELYWFEDLVNAGQGTEVYGGPLGSALWLVNKALELGYEIEAGHILLTGAIGEMIPAQIGVYKANFGKLGMLTFQVQ